jgi:serine/threonine-protein kinase
MPATDTLLNTLFDGRYRILRKLGAGGMANVYLAEDQTLGRRVAIKLLNDRHASDDQFVERFRREATSAAGLTHPNIVSIYDRGEAEGTYYIAMEHLDGRNLKELLRARGPAPVQYSIEYARQILAALRFAHRNGIVHRDIKPHNVLVDSEGRVKVTDFGIARAGGTQMTEVGSIVGTAQYLSPEQARGAPVDQRSDLYSLGVVLYELLTGTVPFSGDAPVEIAMKHLSETPRPPSEVHDNVPRELDLVVMRALAKDPAERYASADEMDRDLARIAAGSGVSPETEEAATAILSAASAPTVVTRANAAPTTAVTRPYRAPPAGPTAVVYDFEERPRRRRSVWPWVIALLLLAGAIAGAVYAYDQIQEQLNAAKPVSVPNVEGIQKELAKARLREDGLRWDIVYENDDNVPVGYVIRQRPRPGDKSERGNVVDLTVSLGQELVDVPDVRGQSSTEAVAELTRLGLEARTVPVASDRPEGTVTAQSIAPGSSVRKETRIRLNVSSGPQLVAVPNVVGQPYDTALVTLQGANFAVARRDVESNAAPGIVVDQTPGANSSAARGSKVTLEVSKGPDTILVPNVVDADRASAVGTLEAAGFRVREEVETTTDETLDDRVLAQSPEPGGRARPGTTITIVVGRFEAPDEPTPDDGDMPPLPDEPLP